MGHLDVLGMYLLLIYYYQSPQIAHLLPKSKFAIYPSFIPAGSFIVLADVFLAESATVINYL